MKYSSLVERISGEGADAWVMHYEARRALDRGESVILLSVGDPDLDSPAPVIERAIEGLRTGDTHYTPVAGREPLRAAIAAQHRARCGQPVEPDNVIFLAGAQNALFAASLCLAGFGDEVIAFEPAVSHLSGRPSRCRARAWCGPRPRPRRAFGSTCAALEALITPRTRAMFFASPNNPSGVIVHESDLAAIGDLADGTDYGWWSTRCTRASRRAGACPASRPGSPNRWSPSAACPNRMP